MNKTSKYCPEPLKKILVPKKTKGQFREIFIPSEDDRRYQKSIILPILEESINLLLSSNCFSYRKNVGVEKCILKIKYLIDNGYKWIVKMDINNFFDNINKEELIRMLPSLISKETLEDVITTINTPYLEKGKLKYKSKGIYQGLPISPILSNLYLMDFDCIWDKGSTELIRYSDDILILTRGRKAAKKASITAKEILRKRGLKVVTEKPINIKEDCLEFLGFSINMDDNIVSINPIESNLSNMLKKISNIHDKAKLSQTIGGWFNFYSWKLINLETYYRIQEMIIDNIGIETWENILDGGLIPYPIPPNTQ